MTKGHHTRGEREEDIVAQREKITPVLKKRSEKAAGRGEKHHLSGGEGRRRERDIVA